jgi:hypothetical protein
MKQPARVCVKLVQKGGLNGCKLNPEYQHLCQTKCIFRQIPGTPIPKELQTQYCVGPTTEPEPLRVDAPVAKLTADFQLS